MLQPVKYKLIVLCFLLQFTNHCAFGQIKEEDIIGIWLTKGDEPAKIQIFKIGDAYYGKIVWLQNPTADGKLRLDVNNSDKSKRNREIIGLQILKDFRFEDNEWSGGKIYDPESGKTYSCTLSLTDKATLTVRGYIGISLLGRTEIWTRASL